MDLSAQYLDQCAMDTGFSAVILEKVTRLGTLARAISIHPVLRHALALKGGTALNLGFGTAPSRLSVDLDYNYIAQAARADMQADRPRIERALEDLICRSGFRLQRSADAFAGRKYHATYDSVFGGQDRVEVDLNFLWRVPLDGVHRATIWQPGELDRLEVQMVSPLELCVGKLLACLDRTAPRDAWDAAQFPIVAGDTLASPLFRTVFIALSGVLPHPLYTYTRAVLARRLAAPTITEQLVPMLMGGHVPNPSEVLDQAWAVLSPFVELAPHERAYIDALHAASLEVHLLCPEDSALAKRLAIHPALLWKLRNVAKRR